VSTCSDIEMLKSDWERKSGDVFREYRMPSIEKLCLGYQELMHMY